MPRSSRSEKSSPDRTSETVQTACILCGSNESVSHISFGSLNYSRCVRCGLIFQNPRVPDVISENVAAFAQAADHYAEKSSGRRRKSYYRKYLRLLRRYCGRSSNNRRSVLEVGCGAGGFLAVARDSNWDVTGVEICKELALIASEKFGLKLLLGELESLHLPSNSFDAAVLNMVVEHLANPLATLREVNRVMRSGGALLIHTPNYADDAVMREPTEKYFPASHVFLFTPETATLLVEKAGFTVRLMRTSGFRLASANLFAKPIEKILAFYFSRRLKGPRLRLIAQKR